MDPISLTETCVESCESMVEYIKKKRITEHRNIGLDENPVTRYDVRGSYAILYASKPIYDTTGLRLKVGNQMIGDEDVSFDKFDNISMSITIYISDSLRDRLVKGGAALFLVIDLMWLINSTRRFYEIFGNYISVPRIKPSFKNTDYLLPSGSVPQKEQVDAVEAVLNNKMSYIWGAPGTGKTQFVLATAILAYIRKGKRVAVVAPTNNSLEQVLRGLLSMITREDPDGKLVNLSHDILRLGTATADFLKEYPEVCEKKGITKQISVKEDTISVLRKVLFIKRAVEIPDLFSRIEGICEEIERGSPGRDALIRELDSCSEDVRRILALDPDSDLVDFDVNRYNYRARIREASDFIYNRPRPEKHNEYYKDWNAERVSDELEKQLTELEELHEMDPMVKAHSAKILAMTPHKFMMRFGPETNGLNKQLHVDHIFIDEVGYCNLIQTLPLFSLGAPISMLGDHLQLQPVCEAEHDDIIVDMIDHVEIQNGFLWEQSALYAESTLTNPI